MGPLLHVSFISPMITDVCMVLPDWRHLTAGSSSSPSHLGYLREDRHASGLIYIIMYVYARRKQRRPRPYPLHIPVTVSSNFALCNINTISNLLAKTSHPCSLSQVLEAYLGSLSLSCSFIQGFFSFLFFYRIDGCFFPFFPFACLEIELQTQAKKRKSGGTRRRNHTYYPYYQSVERSS